MLASSCFLTRTMVSTLGAIGCKDLLSRVPTEIEYACIVRFKSTLCVLNDEVVRAKVLSVLRHGFVPIAVWCGHEASNVPSAFACRIADR